MKTDSFARNELKPRDKALKYGIDTLDNTELLALVLKSSYRDSSVIELSENLIDKANGFDNIPGLSYEELIQIKGIKKAKALEIMAVLEIARRLSEIKMSRNSPKIDKNEIVSYIRFQIAFSDVEKFMVLFFTSSGKIIKSEILFTGDKSASAVGIDEILRKAILYKASFIIVSHNHPGDNCYPSDSDRELTVSLNKLSSLMNIPLLDHIIVSKSSYYSFKYNGLL